MQIQISWLLQKPTDLDLHCLQNRVYPGSAGQGLRENDVIPTEERQRIKKELAKVKHCKLILKTDQPTGYWLVD